MLPKHERVQLVALETQKFQGPSHFSQTVDIWHVDPFQRKMRADASLCGPSRCSSSARHLRF